MFIYTLRFTQVTVIQMSNKKDNGPKAVKRHAALAAERKMEEEILKEKLHNLKHQNRKIIKDYRADIKKLMKEERPLAKEKLKMMTEEMKAAENELKEEHREMVRERKEWARNTRS